MEDAAAAEGRDDGRVSLLGPAGAGRGGPIDDEAWRDLELDALVRTIAGDRRAEAELVPLLRELPADADTIRWRQEVFLDLDADPALVEEFKALLPAFRSLAQASLANKNTQESPLQEAADRIAELECYVLCVSRLSAALGRVPRKSRALGALQARLAAEAAGEDFRRLEAELPAIAAGVRNVRSVTIGVNLDLKLRPFEAALLSVNGEKVTGASTSVMSRLFGPGKTALEGIARLHQPPAKQIVGSAGGVVTLDPNVVGYHVDPILMPLFSDLSMVLRRTAAPLVKELRSYRKVATTFLAGIAGEFSFYLAALAFAETARGAGFKATMPAIAGEGGRIAARGLANPLLLLERARSGGESVVPNDVELGGERRAAVLTGPNRGGKTVFLQSVALAQFLAQQGFPVPAESYAAGAFDRILCHYQREERLERGMGRFGEEAARLASLFKEVTPRSLVLLNESLSSTSMGESLYIAMDLLKAFARLGTVTVFATHMHELVAALEALPAGELSGGVRSLVAKVEEGAGYHRRTYRVAEGRPLGRSYAAELAERYGLSGPQIEAMLRERGF